MDFRSRRTYTFEIDPDALWATISAVENYPRWWPWLRRFDAVGLVPGDLWHCTVQAPLPLAMHFSVQLDEVVEPRLVRASIGGDVNGTATLEIDERAYGCEARLDSVLRPDRRSVRALLFLGRPMIGFGHDWVLDTGARQFSAHARL
jgi:uncharacterized protein YndB with AHSA1/START domain